MWEKRGRGGEFQDEKDLEARSKQDLNTVPIWDSLPTRYEVLSLEPRGIDSTPDDWKRTEL